MGYFKKPTRTSGNYPQSPKSKCSNREYKGNSRIAKRIRFLWEMAGTPSPQSKRGMGKAVQKNLPLYGRRNRKRVSDEYWVLAGRTFRKLPSASSNPET